MSEKEQEMTSKKLGIHIGGNFQDTQEIREVLEQAVFREDEVLQDLSQHLPEVAPLADPRDGQDPMPGDEQVPTAVAREEDEEPAEQTLSRMSRLSRQGEVETDQLESSDDEDQWDEENEEVTVKRRFLKRPVPLTVPIGFSVLLSILQVGLPFLTAFATNQQSQNLYAGWAMTKGQVPFGDIYGTNGFLYYVIDWLGSLAGGHWLFLLLQALALFFAGTSLYRMVRTLTSSEGVAQNVQLLFYFFLLTLGFGGTYVTFFSLPLLFASANLVLAYLEGVKKDEAFIVYGALSALAFLVEPMTSALFYFLVFFGLLAYHIKHKRKARGLYQLFAALLGFSLVFYPIGYVTVWNQTFGYAINQVTYVFHALTYTNGQAFSNAIYYGLLILTLGFASAFLMTFTKQETSAQRIFRFVGWMGSIIVLLVVIGLPEQGAYQLLPLLPFALILFSLWFARGISPAEGKARRARKKGNKETWKAYFSSQAFLPVLAFVYLVAQPFVQGVVIDAGVTSERSQIATYVKKNSQAKDTIYAWDTVATLYEESDRLAASALLTPTSYAGLSENRTNVFNQIQRSEPEFIVVNNQVDLTSDLQKYLTGNYKQIDQKYRHFKVYKRS